MSKSGTVTVEISCDSAPVEEALRRLKIAADEAREALERLGSVNHGGVHIVIAGSLVGESGPEVIGAPKGVMIV